MVIGTRPEAIKLGPVIRALQADAYFKCHVCSTGQHREMLDQVLPVFGIKADVEMDLMQPGQTPNGLAARAIGALDAYLSSERPTMVLVQGDTTTAFCAALAAYYQRIAIGHVEAGLRTGDLYSPWPEEGNRLLITGLAKLHFAPSEAARQNLLRSGVRDDQVFVTGNTVIDALHMALAAIERSPPRINSIPACLQPKISGPRLVLITGHRRENFGSGLANICRAIARLARQFPQVHFVYPVHLNPQVKMAIAEIFGSGDTVAATAPPAYENVHLIDPIGYLEFIALMDRAFLILTDSGGVQEEAPSLGKPVLVMRSTTERTEAIAAGTARMVGAREEAIVEAASELLQRPEAYDRMKSAANPFGDGHASERICAILKRS